MPRFDSSTLLAIAFGALLAAATVGFSAGGVTGRAPNPVMIGSAATHQVRLSNEGNPSISSAGYVSATLCLFDDLLLSGNGVCPYNPNVTTEAFIPDSIAVDATNGNIYVSNEGGGNVSVINDSTNHITSFIGAGSAPTNLALGDRESRLYVTNWASNDVSVIDTQASRLAGTIPVGTHPVGVVYDDRTGDIFVANQGSDNVSVINGTTLIQRGDISGVGAYPSMAAYDSENKYVYLVVQDGVTVINGSSLSVVARISTPAVGYAAADFYDPQNGLLYVSSYGGNNITVVNTTTDSVAGTIDAKAYAGFGFALDSENGLLYEAMTSQNVSVFDPAQNALLGSISYGSTSPDAIAYDGDNGLIYVANGGWDTITIITPGPSPSQGSSSFPYVLVLSPVVAIAAGGTLVWFVIHRRNRQSAPNSNQGSV